MFVMVNIWVLMREIEVCYLVHFPMWPHSPTWGEICTRYLLFDQNLFFYN
jgi:hypothetical protein